MNVLNFKLYKSSSEAVLVIKQLKSQNYARSLKKNLNKENK